MVIRPLRLRDVPAVKQLHAYSIPFDVRRDILYRSDALRLALLGYLSQYHLGPLTLVCEAEGDDAGVMGFAQVWSNPRRAEWSMGTASPPPDEAAAEVWREMARGLCEQAAEHMRLRVLACVIENSPSERTLRASGFLAVTKEEVFCLSQSLSAKKAPENLFPASPQDALLIEELYRQVVPRYIQESQASEAIAAPYGNPFLGTGAPQEYVWIEKGQAKAYFLLSSAPYGEWLEILVRPERRADIAPHIEYVLSHKTLGPEHPAYCPVPDYAAGLGLLLRTLGFEPLHREVQMVMPVAARVPARHPVLAPGRDPGVEARTPAGTCPSMRP